MQMVNETKNSPHLIGLYGNLAKIGILREEEDDAGWTTLQRANNRGKQVRLKSRIKL